MAEHVVSSRVVTLPNALSALRIAMVPVFAALLLDAHDVAALLVLVVSGATDYLDGLLARRWDQVTRLGQVLDPAADRLYIFAALAALAVRGIVPWWLVALIVARDLALLATVPVLRRRGVGTLGVHSAGKAATFALLAAFPLILLSDVIDPTTGAAGSLVRAIGWAVAWWGTALYWWAGWLYLRQVRDIVRERPVSGTPGVPGEPGAPAETDDGRRDGAGPARSAVGGGSR